MELGLASLMVFLGALMAALRLERLFVRLSLSLLLLGGVLGFITGFSLEGALLLLAGGLWLRLGALRWWAVPPAPNATR